MDTFRLLIELFFHEIFDCLWIKLLFTVWIFGMGKILVDLIRWYLEVRENRRCR